MSIYKNQQLQQEQSQDFPQLHVLQLHSILVYFNFIN